MAGDWIKIEIGLAEKPEVIALAEALECGEDLVVGKLVRLWSWANTHLENGNAPSVTQAFLNRYTGVPNFAQELVKVGWLEVTETGIMFPKFDRHNSKSAKSRALGNARVKRKRNAASVTKALPEKRREENTPYPQGGDGDLFEEFWQAYPKQHNRSAAERAWAALGPGPELAREIIQHVERRCLVDPQWDRENGRYIPTATSFLRGKRFEDRIQIPAAELEGEPVDGNPTLRVRE